MKRALPPVRADVLTAASRVPRENEGHEANFIFADGEISLSHSPNGSAPEKRPSRAGIRPNAGIANGKATFHSQSARGAVDHRPSMVEWGLPAISEPSQRGQPPTRDDTPRAVQ